MKPITLALITIDGDEIGRLRMADVAVAPRGASGATRRPRFDREIADLCRRVQDALVGEGLEVDLDAIGLQMAVSRVLLQAGEAEDVLIPVPVRETSDAMDEIDRPQTEAWEDDPALLDGLFDLDASKEKETIDD